MASSPITLSEMVGLLRLESERGCALLAGESLNELSASILRRSVLDDSTADELLGNRGEFGAFSSRIRGCFAFGLISKECRDALNIVRGIRNDAAHFETKRGEGFLFSLSSPAIQSRIASLRRLFEESPQHLGVDPREEFIAAVAGISGYLFRQRERATRPRPGEEWFKY
jgi:hypothetical protein